MADRPSFVVEDQSGIIAFLERRLASDRRIDTHGAVVFLTEDRAYKLKRAVKFPYMDFSTADLRRRMCAAEIEFNRRLAPEVYLGVVPVLKRGGDFELGELNAPAADAADWLVMMQRFDDEALFDKLAEKGELTPALMSALGARIAAFQDGLPPIRSTFCTPEAYRHSVASDVAQMIDKGETLDPAASAALAKALPESLEPF
ncbi:MAG: aminoglycoside phosphotransferase, partial [Alphaproteobacteria bacterium]|nr:aminoglycoside phosphotransferase [Alphaproteobacteria bacterium]